MMGAPELMALSIAASVGVAAFAWLAGRLIERVCDDPGLRDRVWAVALVLPVLPPLATALLLSTPAPVRELAAPTVTARAMTPAAAVPSAVLDQGPTLEPSMIAWTLLAVAVVLTLVRLAALTARAVRLRRILRTADAAPPAFTAGLTELAERLGVRTPSVLVSDIAPEALLSGLGRTRLVLPRALAEGPADAARAVVAHELAHLKRRDHRTIWLEEALLVALAVNPMMPVLRRRRDAAREEACDALALGQAAPDARRAYAQTLIDALRNRAGSQTSGGALPALTFTGAGRTFAMRRLKAVMNPAAPAGRGTWVVAAVLGLSLMGATGATTAALASQREPEFRVPAAQAGAWGPRFDLPYEFRINGQRIDINPATLPPFGFAGEEIKSSERQGSEAPAWVDVRVTVDPAAPPLSLEGVALPRGVRPDVIMPEFVERIDRSESGLNIVLKREAKPDARPQARPSPDARPSRLTPEQQNRYQRVSASQFQTICASGQPSDDGFCAGVMFSFLTRAPSQGMCLPGDDEPVAGPALSAYVDRAKVQVAGLSPRADEGAYEFAGRALAVAYPCAAQDGGAGL